jgi:hypothetical protein
MGASSAAPVDGQATAPAVLSTAPLPDGLLCCAIVLAGCRAQQDSYLASRWQWQWFLLLLLLLLQQPAGKLREHTAVIAFMCNGDKLFWHGVLFS